MWEGGSISSSCKRPVSLPRLAGMNRFISVNRERDMQAVIDAAELMEYNYYAEVVLDDRLLPLAIKLAGEPNARQN